MRRMPLLLVAIAVLPAARAVPPDRSTHSRLALLHEIEDDVRELDGALVLSSTNDGALRELERRIFHESKEFNGLFKEAGKPGIIIETFAFGAMVNEMNAEEKESFWKLTREQRLEKKFLRMLKATAPPEPCKTVHCPGEKDLTYREYVSKYTVLMEMVRNYDWPEGANEVLGRGLDVHLPIRPRVTESQLSGVALRQLYLP